MPLVRNKDPSSKGTPDCRVVLVLGTIACDFSPLEGGVCDGRRPHL